MSEHCVSPCPFGYTFAHTVEWCGRKPENAIESMWEKHEDAADHCGFNRATFDACIAVVVAEVEERCAERGHLTSEDLRQMREEVRTVILDDVALAYRRLRGYPPQGPAAGDEILELLVRYR